VFLTVSVESAEALLLSVFVGRIKTDKATGNIVSKMEVAQY